MVRSITFTNIMLRVALTVAGVLIVSILLYPVAYAFLMSVLGKEGIFLTSLSQLEEYGVNPWRYVEVLRDPEFVKSLVTSLVVALLTILISVVVITPAAYGFSRFRFWGRDSLLYVYLIMSQVGGGFGIMATVALYIFLLRLNAMGVPVLGNMFILPVIYSSGLVPFMTWLLKTYFDSLPKELDEAAFMDGASWTTIVFRVILPASRSAIIIITLFAFMSAWGEFILANFLGVSTLAQYIFQTAFGARGLELPARFAANAILFAIPTIVIYVVAQRYIGEAMRMGAVRG
ncbi:ABC transporter permease subunit [Thermogladius sp.]|uniref:ABC transporter permease subunit n=1 Tax=Thermogladius sp. TaxID=2023064 RepID=UPI003D0A9B38